MTGALAGAFDFGSGSSASASISADVQRVAWRVHVLVDGKLAKYLTLSVK